MPDTRMFTKHKVSAIWWAAGMLYNVCILESYKLMSEPYLTCGTWHNWVTQNCTQGFVGPCTAGVWLLDGQSRIITKLRAVPKWLMSISTSSHLQERCEDADENWLRLTEATLEQPWIWWLFYFGRPTNRRLLYRARLKVVSQVVWMLHEKPGRSGKQEQ